MHGKDYDVSIHGEKSNVSELFDEVGDRKRSKRDSEMIALRMSETWKYHKKYLIDW